MNAASLFVQHQHLPSNITVLDAMGEIVRTLPQKGSPHGVLQKMNEVLRRSDNSTADNTNVPALKK